MASKSLLKSRAPESTEQSPHSAQALVIFLYRNGPYEKWWTWADSNRRPTD